MDISSSANAVAPLTQEVDTRNAKLPSCLVNSLRSELQGHILSYLRKYDRLAITATCRNLAVFRADAKRWSANFKLYVRPKTKEELGQTVVRIGCQTQIALKIPIELNLSKIHPSIPELQDIISSNSQFSNRIETLICALQGMIEEAFECFQRLPNLKTLNVSQLDLASFHLLLACKHLNSLTTIDFSYKRIGDKGVSSFAQSVAFPVLSDLNLCGNRIGAIGVRAIAQSMHLRSLTNLDLSWNYLGSNEAIVLAGSEHLTSLTGLNLKRNRICNVGVIALTLSEHFKKLTALNLSWNKIDAGGAIALAGSNHFHALTHLNLSNNAIGSFGVIALTQSHSLVYLSSLNLNQCSVRSDTLNAWRRQHVHINEQGGADT